MTHIYERREINNQSFLMVFDFPSYDDGNHFSLSLDKYLGADVWSQIYRKLEPKLKAYLDHTDATEKSDQIYLNRAQLKLDVAWKTCKSFQKDAGRAIKMKGCDGSFENVLIVKVRMISALDELRKRQGLEKTAEKKSSESINSEASASGSSGAVAAATESRSSNGSTSQPKSQSQSQNVEEYVPEPVTIDIASSLKYTPSTLSKKQLSEASIISNSNENVAATLLDDVHDDVYTPSQKGGSNDSQAITYTPKKIEHTSQKTDWNRNDFAEKKAKRTKSKHKMVNIFGEGDSGDEIDKDSKIGLRRDLRSTPTTSQMESAKTPKVQGKLTDWVSTRAKRQDVKKDCDRADNKRKVRKIGANEKSGGIRKDMNEAEKLRYLRELDEKMDDTGVTVGHHFDLKDMDIEKVVDTYAEHKAALDKFYRINQKTPDHRWQPEEDYLVILNGLLSESQQQKMYLKIKAEYAKESLNNVTSNHENLFWKGMLPEWALLIFMEKYFFDRAEAIKQLSNQDREIVQQNYPFNLDDL